MNKNLLLVIVVVAIVIGVIILFVMNSVIPPEAKPKVTFGHEINYQTTDGFTIYGNYMPNQKNSSGIILLHMLGRDRNDYAGLAQELNRNGYTVLAIDFRGHGKSIQQNGKAVTWQQFSDQDFNSMVNDVAGAKKYLTDQGVNTDRIGIVGASIGANVALNYAAQDKTIKAIVLLSPGMNYRGVKTRDVMISYGARPVFMVASTEDTASYEAVNTLSSLQPNGKVDTKFYSGAGHGTEMFSQPDLDGLVVKWLKENLVVS